MFSMVAIPLLALAGADHVVNGAKSAPGRLPQNETAKRAFEPISPEPFVLSCINPTQPGRQSMRAGPRLTLLAAALAAAFMLAPPASTSARAEDGQGTVAPTPTDQQTLPPSTSGCPYRGGKLELIA
jgi:hypothetical protein